MIGADIEWSVEWHYRNKERYCIWTVLYEHHKTGSVNNFLMYLHPRLRNSTKHIRNEAIIYMFVEIRGTILKLHPCFAFGTFATYVWWYKQDWQVNTSRQGKVWFLWRLIIGGGQISQISTKIKRPPFDK